MKTYRVNINGEMTRVTTRNRIALAWTLNATKWYTVDDIFYLVGVNNVDVQSTGGITVKGFEEKEWRNI